MIATSNLKMYLYIVSIIVGLRLNYILGLFGVLTGIQGIRYYAEVHLSYLNSIVHTLGMPFTYIGINIAVPALLNLSVGKTRVLQWCVYLVYISHYATISIPVALITACIYYYTVKVSLRLYQMQLERTGRFWVMMQGLSITVLALSCQEFFGHYLGGDNQSRIEGIFNAILYAKFYSIGHYFPGLNLTQS